ncbi:MAG: copper amine oxidase N-terminal domain-containing protein [Bacillota bacterium]|nr:copper amine oxidase N-terminal domain-containing protein [Eubacteriales bacterium]
MKRRLSAWSLALVVGLLLLCPSSALAATSYDFLRGQMWSVPQNASVQLGILSVRVEPLVDGTHTALFALPRDFEMVLPGDIASIEDPTVVLTTRRTAGNEFLGSFALAGGGNQRYTFLIPIHSTIPSETSGDIEISITGIEGQLRGGAVVTGQGWPGEIRIETTGAGLIRDGKSSVRISFSENMAGLFRADSPIRLTLPEGFSWANAGGSLTEGEGLKATPVVDGRVLEMRTERPSTTRSSFLVEAEVRLDDAALAKEGEVRAQVQGLRALSSATVLVAHYQPPVIIPEPEPEPRTVVFSIGSSQYTINGKEHPVDVAPYTINGRTFLPLRYVGLSLSVDADDIKWDGSAAILTKGDKTVIVRPGSKILQVNKTGREMDVTPEIVPPGRIMLPYRFIAEAFGASVGWDGATRTVTMSVGGQT